MPPQVAQAMQAMQQKIQQLEQVIATDEAKAMAKAKANIMEAQAEAQLPPSSSDRVKLQIADMTSARAAQAGVAEMEIKVGNADADRRVAILEMMLKVAKEERLAAQEHISTAATQGRDHAASALETAATHVHEKVTQAAEHAHERTMAALTHQHALEQAQTQADLTPEPDQPQNGGSAAPSGV